VEEKLEETVKPFLGKNVISVPNAKKSFVRKRNAPVVKFSDFLAFYRFICGKENTQGLTENLSVSRTTLWSRFGPFWKVVLSPKEINKLFPLKLLA
jgi:hypothetical protein